VPLDSPNLDDLRFATVRDLLVRQIPIVAPEWTDHNDSDPGIAMIQLFAYLAEQIGFRLNRVPDKNYIEFLRLLGVTLRPAEAARTQLEFILTKPELADAFLIAKGTRAKAKSGGGSAGPPTFETDGDLDAVPAQLAVLATTASSDLRDLLLATGLDGSKANTQVGFLASLFALVWDGKSPKLKDMPAQPVPIFTGGNASGQQHLWIGLAFNPSPTAGFVAQRVTLWVQFDDDEQPDPHADVRCGTAIPSSAASAALPAPPMVSYQYYRPAQTALGETVGGWKPLTILSDATNGWVQAGAIRFDVPTNIGPIPDAEWLDVYAPTAATLASLCAQASSGGGAPPPKPVPHPLVGAVKSPVDGLPPNVKKVPVSGWLHVGFSTPIRASLRALSFNVTSAANALTVRGEVLGRGTGLPGQVLGLAQGNVLAPLRARMRQPAESNRSRASRGGPVASSAAAMAAELRSTARCTSGMKLMTSTLPCRTRKCSSLTGRRGRSFSATECTGAHRPMSNRSWLFNTAGAAALPERSA